MTVESPHGRSKTHSEEKKEWEDFTWNKKHLRNTIVETKKASKLCLKFNLEFKKGLVK